MLKKITVMIYYDKKNHKKYMKLFDKLDYDKFEPTGSIVMIKNSLFWHDYKLTNDDDLGEFMRYFEPISNHYSIYIK